MIVLAVAVAGGAGAVARFLLDGLVKRRTGGGFPAGTVIINLSGSLLLGLISGLVAGGLPTQLEPVAGTGFLGGYTTFSAASVETVGLLRQRRYAAALGNGVGTLVAAVALAAAGFLLGSRLA